MADDGPSAFGTESASPFALLARLLADQADVVAGLTAEEYSARPAGFPGGIGPQIRHCRDHVAAVVAGAESGRIDYESRRRGTTLETRRSEALATLRDLEKRLLRLCTVDLERPVRVVDRLDPMGGRLEFGSTFGREIAFVVSHTTHHNALIATMARALGQAVPERFGFAASTISYLDRLACAR